MDFSSLAQTVYRFLTENWSIIVSVALGMALYRFARAGLHIIGTIVLVGLAITIATHLGLCPPIDVMLAEIIQKIKDIITSFAGDPIVLT